MSSLSNLTDGTHILKAYSLEKTGNEMKNSVEFTVDSTINNTPTPAVPEFPLWTIPLLLMIMVASAGLLVYHKKQRQRNKHT